MNIPFGRVCKTLDDRLAPVVDVRPRMESADAHTWYAFRSHCAQKSFSAADRLHPSDNTTPRIISSRAPTRPYSLRSATIGSTVVARRAGT
jgi:hypothetical protein